MGVLIGIAAGVAAAVCLICVEYWHYKRTCAWCGFHWRVPMDQAPICPACQRYRDGHRAY